MNDRQRDFLDALLDTRGPSGFEATTQRVWVEYVSAFADEVTTDAYGNAVATYYGSSDAETSSDAESSTDSDTDSGSDADAGSDLDSDAESSSDADAGSGAGSKAGPEIAFAGHADEIGLIVRDIDDEGFCRLDSIGGVDRTVTQGQRVRVHATDGPIPGVIGQTAIHLRDRDEDSLTDISEQYVDIGSESREETEQVIDIGDPITVAVGVEELRNTRLAARGMDNRIGIWAAAEGLRLAAEREVNGTIHAVSTVQEEVGLEGARMVGFDLAPDAVIAIDVTHATDHPNSPNEKASTISLGDGPVIARGSTNHPILVDLAREAATESEISVQLQASGSRTGTDADAFYTARGATPALSIGLPNRYMHTPVEVIDPVDLADVAELLGSFAALASERDGFDLQV